MFIIIDGSPVDGLNFTGPFQTHDEALKSAERLDTSWWIGTLDKTEKD